MTGTSDLYWNIRQVSRNMVQLAKRIARNCHEGQFRKDGVTPHIVYPARVAARLNWPDLDDNIADSASLPKGEQNVFVQRWQASRRTLLAVGSDLKGLLRLSE